jgi:glucokinase
VSREDGSLLARVRQPTLAEQGPGVGLKRIAEMVDEITTQTDLSLSDLAGIGIGCTGPLDLERGLIMEPWTMPGWTDVPVVATLADRFGLPVLLDNDCNMAALGEHWIGAGRGMANLLYVAVSTGIGAGRHRR